LEVISYFAVQFNPILVHNLESVWYTPFVIGQDSESDCSSMDICNGPLKPGKTYRYLNWNALYCQSNSNSKRFILRFTVNCTFSHLVHIYVKLIFKRVYFLLSITTVSYGHVLPLFGLSSFIVIGYVSS